MMPMLLRPLSFAAWAVFFVSCVTAPLASKAEQVSSARRELREMADRVSGPCDRDMDCVYFAVEGSCCVCGLPRSVRSPHPPDGERLAELCHLMSLDMDEEELVSCDCPAQPPSIRCDLGVCRL